MHLDQKNITWNNDKSALISLCLVLFLDVFNCDDDDSCISTDFFILSNWGVGNTEKLNKNKD